MTGAPGAVPCPAPHRGLPFPSLPSLTAPLMLGWVPASQHPALHPGSHSACRAPWKPPWKPKAIALSHSCTTPTSPYPHIPTYSCPHFPTGEHPLPDLASICAIPAGCFLLKEIPGTGWGRGTASMGCEQQWEGVPVCPVSTQCPVPTCCWGLQGWETASHFVSAFVLQVQQSQTHSTHSRKGKAAVKPAGAQVLPHPHSTCAWLLCTRHRGACRQPRS